MSNSRQIASLPNILTLIDDAGGQFIKQQAAGVTTSYTITWPSAVGSSGAVLALTDGSGGLGWQSTLGIALSGGTVNNSIIGGSTPAAITGTTITANTAFVGPLTGNSTTATALATGRTFAFTGDATGTSASFDGSANVSTSLTLAASGVSAASYGSATAIPVLTIDAKGRVTSASTASISSALTIGADSGSNDTVTIGTDTLNFVGTGSEIETTVSNNQIQIGLPSTVSGLTTVSATNLQGALAGTIASTTTGATQAASDNSTKIATTAYVTTALANLVDSAPGALNTLNELAAALGDDASFSTTVTNALAGKLALAGGTMTGDLILGDNVKLEIGSASGGDLQIYHDGNHSYIDDAGTGNLFIRSGTLTVSNLAGNKNSAVFSSAGAQTFYYDNTVRLQTTTTGAYVNGRLEVATIESSANKGVAFGSHILPTSSATTTDDTVDLGSSSYRFRQIHGTQLYGTLQTAAQTNITSVGTLSSLTVSGALNATLATAAQTNITSVGTLSSLNVSGTVTANAFAGTLSTAAQTNITSVGTLSSLTVSGDVTVDTNTLKVDSGNNRVGILNASPDVTLDIGSATDSIHIPVGTTAQRPGSPAAGYFRYNSSLSQFEGYTSAWGAIGGGGTNTFNHNVFTGDGSTTAFALAAATESENNLLVFIDGVFQEQGAYSIATSGGTTTLTMSAAPASGRKLVVYQVSAGVSGSNLNIDTMTGDGSDTTLTLSIAPVNENNTQVFFDGVYQNKSTYSISGTTLTFSTAPPTGVAVEVMTFTQTEVNVPVNDTIDTVHIKAGAVTTAKIESSLDLSSKTLTLPAVAVPSASTATTQAASDNTTKLATTAYVTTAIANLIDGAPGTLNTLNELAAALADDASFSSSVTTSLAAKANLAAPNFTGNVTFDSTTLTVDATNNRVGIGTASPASPLDVTGTITADGLTMASGSQSVIGVFGTSGLQLIGTTGGDNIVGTMGSSEPLVFRTVASERMRIDSSGKVGIGTASPQHQAQILDALKISNSAQSEGSLILGDGSSTNFNVGIARWNGASNAAGAGGIGYMSQGSGNSGGHFFYTGDAVAGSQTERMRIDTSGNFLVGKSVTNISTVGTLIGSTGYISITRTGLEPITINRLSSDGDVIAIRKDGGASGSIGAHGSSGIYMSAPTNGGAAIILNDNAPIIYPGKNNSGTRAATDNAIDLGASAVRFKDLYLSNLARIDGTNAYIIGVKIKNNYSSVQSDWNIGAAGGTSGWGNANGNFIVRDDTTNSTAFEAERGAGGAFGAVYVDSTSKVGIGTPSPASWSQLHVAAAAGGDQTGADQALYVHAPTATNGHGVGIRLSAASGSREAVGIISMVNNASGNAGSMAFHTYNLGATIPEVMRIDNTGKVGIGTTSPTGILDVSLTASAHTGGIAITNLQSGGYGSGLSFNSKRSDDQSIKTAARIRTEGHESWNADNTTSSSLIFETRKDNTLAEKMRIVTDGKVGIGTGSPDARVHIMNGDASATSNAGAVLTVENNGDCFIQMLTPNSNSQQLRFGDPQDDGAGSLGYNHSTSTMNFSVNGPVRMSLNSAGNLSIPYTSSGAGNADLRFNTGNGDVTYNTSSRLVKENIEDIPYGLEAVKNLSPKKYKRTDSDNIVEVGFIADEVMEVIPELVGIMKKSVFTKEESDTEDIPGSVFYSQMTAVLVKAIQEQQALIEALQTKVAALEGE